MQMYPSNVMSLNPCNLLASIIVSTLGFGAAAYGKKLGLWQPVAIGACLIIYPYFLPTSGFYVASGPVCRCGCGFITTSEPIKKMRRN